MKNVFAFLIKNAHILEAAVTAVKHFADLVKRNKDVPDSPPSVEANGEVVKD